MKKVRNTLIIALLVCTVISTGLVAGTYAKYTSTATLTDTARVAKWDIDVEGEDMTATTEIDLFKYAETNVKNTDGTVDGLIAPGTTGSFAIDVENKGEVTAEYIISFTAENTAGIPIEYSIDNSTWTTDITTLSFEEELAIGSTASSKTIYWRWAFERGADEAGIAANDTIDTGLGIDGTAEVTVTATITATQVD